MSCNRGCSGNWDVRCCCEINCPAKNSNLQFKRCPMKINTILFHIGNDEDLYLCATNDEFEYIQEYFDITDEELDTVMELWNDENPTDTEC